MRFRPQVFAGILVLGGIGVFALVKGQVEITTGCIGAISALSMALVQGEK